MKKIIQLSLIALLFSFVACSDATDIRQESELTEDLAYQTVGDLQSGLFGAYGAYTPDAGSNGLGDAILFNDLFTDNLKSGSSNNGQGATEYNFIIQPGTYAANSIWDGRYGAINRINRVLRAYNRIFPNLTGDDVVAAEKIKGQLLVLRALCHFDLFQYFTPDYTDPAGLAVIKMDFVPASVEDFFPRNTVAEILDFINADIEEAYDLLGNVNASDTGFINQDVAHALQARVAVTSGNYPLARTLAAGLMGDNALASKTAYPNLFRRSGGAGAGLAAPPELIFSLIRLAADPGGIVDTYYANGAALDGLPFFEASRQLYDLYDNQDVRKDVNFIPEVENGSDIDAGIILIGKYVGTEQNTLSNDVPVFRSSEMLLIRAECEARAGELTTAATSLRSLWIARYGSAAAAPPTPVFNSLPDALAAILLERRKELVFEGHRYLDLKRLGAELGIGINRLQSDADSFSAPAILPASDYRFTLPIPQDELNANDIIIQNPGYSAN